MPALSIQDYLKRPMPEHNWLIDQLLPANGSLELYGSPKAGKSLFALGMAAAISDFLPDFLGFPVHQHGRVLYVQVDMSPPLFFDYVKLAHDASRPFEQLWIIDRWELPDRTLNLLKNKHLEWLKGQIDMVQPVAVFLDALRSFHDKDENDSTVMANLMERIKPALGTAALTLIHHGRKPTSSGYESVTTEGRGSNAVAGAVDVVAQLSGRSISKRKLKYETRTRNWFPDGLDLQQNDGAHHDGTGLYEVRLSSAQVLEQLQATIPNATVKQLVDGLIEQGVSKSQAYKLLKATPS